MTEPLRGASSDQQPASSREAMQRLADIIQATGLTVNDYALHVLHCHPSRLYSLGLGGGGATPVTLR